MQCNLWSVLENVPCVLEKHVYSDAVGWIILRMCVRFIWSNVQFKHNVSWFIFCLVILSIVESRILKYPAIIVLLSISPIWSVNICFMYVQCTNTYSCCIPLMNWPPCYYIMTCFALLLVTFWLKAYFVWCKHYYPWFLLVSVFMEYLFQPLTFSLCVFLKLKLVPYRQHIVGYWFLSIQPLCLLIVEFSTFIVNDRYGITLAFSLIFSGWFIILLLLSSSLALWFDYTLVVCFESFLFIFCESTIGFCFVVIMMFI